VCLYYLLVLADSACACSTRSDSPLCALHFTFQAFQEGKYYDDNDDLSFGAGKYGDLAAMAAAFLLDREHRSVELTHDPFYGSLREPSLKVIAFLRAMNFQKNTPMLQLDHLDGRSKFSFSYAIFVDEHIRIIAHTSHIFFKPVSWTSTLRAKICVFLLQTRVRTTWTSIKRSGGCSGGRGHVK